VPKWIGTHAATETQTAAPVQAPATVPTPTPEPVPPPKEEPVPAPVPETVAEPVEEAPRPQVKTAAPAPPRPAPVVEQKPVATQAPAAAPTPAATPPAAIPAPPAAVPMEPLRHRFELLATRANTARAALRRLESEQQRQGLGLRADAKNAESRMLLFMDNAEAALKAGNAASSKTNMDSAEREVERLEALLGI
jgi:outer membrane biosynthesis protein TonB